MSDLVQRVPRPPLTRVDMFAANLREIIEPTWGMFDATAAYARNEVKGEQLPSASMLDGMREELLRALAPLSDTGADGLARALQATRLLNESFPQRDATGPAWARGVAARLAECPPDLVARVVEGLLDTHDYRPALAEVKRAVAEAVAGRKLNLLRVEAALRWRAAHAAQQRADLATVLPMPRMPTVHGAASGAEDQPDRPMAANDR